MMTISRKLMGIAGLASALLATAGAANALSIDLNSTQVGAFGAGPYGTVTLTQNGSNVDFSVALKADLAFVTTGNQNSHSVFTFNAADIVLADITNIDNPGAQTFGAWAPAGNSPFGNFGFGIYCATNCSNGLSGSGYGDPLTFTVLNSVIANFLSLSSAGIPTRTLLQT